MPRTSTSVTSDPPAIRRKVMRWYRDNGRHDLPWRSTRDPYAVLVSEVMLQQTQVDRVLPYYEAWMKRWPDLRALAPAPVAEVIRAWRGLGYNRRAVNVHRLAVTVVEFHRGTLPVDAKALRGLPGVGEYTAAAVRCFAGEERVVVADTNIARLAARAVLGVSNRRDLRPMDVRGALEGLLPMRGAREHNLALMDLGATVCTARAPKCDVCPLVTMCRWRSAGYVESMRMTALAPKFETTARFARGRIVDALREAPAKAQELREMLPERHHANVEKYLEALAADGMVVEQGGVWRLPE